MMEDVGDGGLQRVVEVNVSEAQDEARRCADAVIATAFISEDKSTGVRKIVGFERAQIEQALSPILAEMRRAAEQRGERAEFERIYQRILGRIPGGSSAAFILSLDQALEELEQEGERAGLEKAAKVCELVAKGHAALRQGYRVDACLACANQVRALLLSLEAPRQ